MDKFWKSLSGKKTYIVAAVTVAYALTQFWAGALPVEAVIALIFGALGLSALRNGIK